MPPPEVRLSVSAPIVHDQMVTSPDTPSVPAPALSSSSRGDQSPLADVFRQKLRSLGMDERALAEATMEDLRLLLRHLPPSDGN